MKLDEIHAVRAGAAGPQQAYRSERGSNSVLAALMARLNVYLGRPLRDADEAPRPNTLIHREATRMSPIARPSAETAIAASSAAVRDGRRVLLRPVAAGDAGRVQSFVRALSPQSRRSRFFCGLTELPHHVLLRLTQPDYPKDSGLLALAGGPDDRSVVGMAQYASDGPGRAEFSVAVADAWQRQGLGARLIQALVHQASIAGVETLCAVMFAENRAMLALAEQLGFRAAGSPEFDLVQVERSLARKPGYCLPGRFVAAWAR